jgi:hypothetical protein
MTVSRLVGGDKELTAQIMQLAKDDDPPSFLVGTMLVWKTSEQFNRIWCNTQSSQPSDSD